MIEINLLPGTGRKKAKRSGGGGGGGGITLPKIDFGAWFANIRERVTEPWLLGGVATTAVVLSAVAGMYVLQSRREAKVEEATQKAVQDSTRYAAVLKEREKAEAKRDTVLRSLNLIRAIDDDRFIWPHVLDEVSRALPPYTWLVSLTYARWRGRPQAPLRADRHPARHRPASSDREHGRHPGAHALHDAARVIAVLRSGATRQVGAGQRQRKRSDAVPARPAL
jgi:hypothetical protein